MIFTDIFKNVRNFWTFLVPTTNFAEFFDNELIRITHVSKFSHKKFSAKIEATIKFKITLQFIEELYGFFPF